jgi:ABC-type antimicrobial peptide transport system ATPase subunit
MSPTPPVLADVDELKSKINRLIGACPVTHDNPVGCQLHAIRLMSTQARADWAESQSIDELQQIAIRHHACMQTRMFMQSFE